MGFSAKSQGPGKLSVGKVPRAARSPLCRAHLPDSPTGAHTLGARPRAPHGNTQEKHGV